ncbi:MAG: DUF1501 domain-containing protein [Planctomycetales bacterium]|nr:DUF1501 domain-containing protein [Planctomycetales bacterium]
MNALNALMLNETRRSFLRHSSIGIGSAALATMLSRDLSAQQPEISGALDALHYAQKAKRVIFLCMAGGPSHLETFDYKPELAKLDGQPMPKSFTDGQPIAQLQGQKNNLKCLGPQHPFKAFGESGQMISEALPHIGSIADEICVVRSLRTKAINHDPAHTLMNTGTTISGRPSMGSWLWYGLGSMADDLPGFVVLTSVGGGQSQPIASRQWHSGFLPSRFQGVPFQSKGDAVLYLGRPDGVGAAQQRDVVDSVQALNKLGDAVLDDREIATRISQYEMAFKMQTSVPELMDLKQEPKHVLDLYGIGGADGSFAANCLVARRLAQRGVRFIHLYHRGWDHHGGVKGGVAATAKLVDQGSAALVKDLKQQGMLDDTLVIWGGEFGRTPMAQGSGRDHHIKGFSCWLAGGGIRGGASYGATDELGYNAAEDIFEVHDLHATMLYLLGVDHLRLTVPFQGRDMRLTDVHGKVVKEILA